MGRLRRGQWYEELSDGATAYHILAPGAAMASVSTISLTGGLDADGRQTDVLLKVFEDGQLRQTIVATQGHLTAKVPELRSEMSVTLSLKGTVQVIPAAGPGHAVDQSYRTDEWQRGLIPLPESVRKVAAQHVTLDQLEANRDAYARDKNIAPKLEKLYGERIPRLLLSVVAEMHQRVAYGASCFIMVAMGAALGLMFRGGQVIMAFALTVVPAVMVIAMVYMGTTMMSNPDLPIMLGIATTWGGTGLIGLVNVYIYWRLSRR